ncbi:hypothetical protein Q4574_20760 [Aliiglaciecola sp. 3_MG-2023]|uniref:hypothetical protein n=1 Tax=Aliiglaciecola sp. 3_MG-2023 TaxID=3062644 RepID=UPI0026E2F6EB|nr:hypothetical protein [Aliiglaciecola sp. 3_MG-2023]MDO6695742.1 hypothetical protein [Aliiglaciecola sp. 3_MG-2023]
MYNDEDLKQAVEAGIFTDDSVSQFKSYVAKIKNTSLADEENFRLISGFNDIFVVIASGLLLASIGFLGYHVSPLLGTIGVAIASWLLSEFFVLKRRMALPAIMLLLTFLGGVFASPLVIQQQPNEMAFLIAGALSAVAAVLHWRRFRVPITVAAGAAAISSSIIALILVLIPNAVTWVNPLLLCVGLGIFGLAMYWDASDRNRQTRSSDVAFWLHLAAAPLIVHPIFTSLGILQGVGGLSISLLVLGLYVLLATISIAVDRRAIMVSALVYVIYAFSTLLETYGMVSYSFAITGLCIGGTLLLLSAFWQVSRSQILKLLPLPVQDLLPAAHS